MENKIYAYSLDPNAAWKGTTAGSEPNRMLVLIMESFLRASVMFCHVLFALNILLAEVVNWRHNPERRTNRPRSVGALKCEEFRANVGNRHSRVTSASMCCVTDVSLANPPVMTAARGAHGSQTRISPPSWRAAEQRSRATSYAPAPIQTVDDES